MPLLIFVALLLETGSFSFAAEKQPVDPKRNQPRALAQKCKATISEDFAPGGFDVQMEDVDVAVSDAGEVTVGDSIGTNYKGRWRLVKCPKQSGKCLQDVRAKKYHHPNCQ